MAATAVGAPANAGALVPHTRLPVRAAIPQARPARIMIDGPSGSGLSWTALDLAVGLAGDGGRIAVIDTNGGAVLRYADAFRFGVVELYEFAPENLMVALYEVGSRGCDVVIVDDFSRFWSGPGGLLELVDTETARADQAAAKAKLPRPGTSAGWTAVRPRERAALDALLAFPGHVVVTVRAMTETVLQEGGPAGTVPRRYGLKLDQRQGVEAPFDIAFSLLPGGEHHAVVTKSRLSALDGQLLRFDVQPARTVGTQINEWARQGVDCWPKASFYTTAYSPESTIEDLGRLLGQIADTRAQHMAAYNDQPRPDWNEVEGGPIALGALVERHLARLREQAERARRAAPPGPRNQPPRPQPRAEQPPAAPGPAVAAPGGAATDRPASLPVEMPTSGETDPVVLAVAATVEKIRADGAWDDTLKLAAAFMFGSERRALQELVHCEDGRYVELRTLVQTRQSELKDRALFDAA